MHTCKQKNQIDKFKKHITNQFEAILLAFNFSNTIIHLANIYIATMASLNSVFSFIQATIANCPPSAKVMRF